MGIATEALSSLITRLGVLLTDEYKLRKREMRQIQLLQAELEATKDALEKISDTPADQLHVHCKFWDRDLREFFYDMEDCIDRHVPSLRKATRRRGIDSQIIYLKARVAEVHKQLLRYHANLGADKLPAADPRLFSPYTKIKQLVGIDKTRDELIKIVREGNGVPSQQGKIVSIVGCGGVGKTTLAHAVCEEIRAEFDCYAFVSVSQTPDLGKLFKAILYQLRIYKYDDNFNITSFSMRDLIDELKRFLRHKRYLVVVDDIWDISVWELIKCALPDNDVRYLVITTTRNVDVAKKAGGAYKLKPLSENDSRKLLYRRVLGNKNNNNVEHMGKCPDELAEVSHRILKKCSGVPLAIITMASLLASKARNKIDWNDVCNSIGPDLDNNLDIHKMRKILTLSYYEMPSHLRICLLYVSMFPQDYRVEKNCLIWMWIAEGFIQCETEGKSLFAIGESYFDELTNRSMIQPIYDKCTGLIHACHVHDMMQDLIFNLSSEENFVSILNDAYYTIASKIRRLSLQYGKKDNYRLLHRTSLQQVRSAIVFPSAFRVMPDLTKFKVLRVLNLQDCDFSQGYCLKYVENLFHLRYLGLCATHISQLPEGIGNLEFLQTLDVRGNNMFSLPSTIVQLRSLMCLYIDEFTRVPNGNGRLTNLEVLSTLDITASIDIIEELGQLMKLRVLHILLFIGWSRKLVESLSKLQNVQYLHIKGFGDNQCYFSGLDDWVAPQHLYRLDIEWPCWFSTLPSWMNQSYLPDLVYLSIAVRDIGQVNLETLGRLPALRLLKLSVDPKNLRTLGGFIIGAGLFPCLVFFQFGGSLGPIIFQKGAMPRVEILNFEFCVQAARQIACNGDGPELGLGNLSSLQDVKIYLHSRGASKEEVKELEAVLRHAVEIHPNLPKHQIC